MTQSKKILIADDEPNIVISLEFLMKREGFDVSIAGDGEEAIAKIRSDSPDLVLLDVMMPKKSGFDVCQEVKGDPALSATRIRPTTTSICGPWNTGPTILPGSTWTTGWISSRRSSGAGAAD